MTVHPSYDSGGLRVSIHTPTQGVTLWWARIATLFRVSIHTPTQGVTSFTAVTLQVGEVSIHTPTQGVTKLRLLCFGSSWFQSTHPRRVWLRSPDRISSPSKFQSTHPRRVWRTATWYLLFSRVSIHTPTQGVTPGRSIKSSMCRFQSTHPRRVWHSPLWYPRLSMPVSIHTPTQGVTNITIRTGSIHSFNPHTHAGCDNFDLIDMFDFRVSIHTPTQGVTRREMVLYSFSWVSIHTPTQGVTQI